ncbi:hypothetical protein F4780DRAFT_783656 [Xylariomycetidae sp. FL0641]|nr:hypothetical protein F4780DRAFT_783656 [Xylariomycetidae sp. FL0641]
MASLFESLEAQGIREREKPIFDVLKASLDHPAAPDTLPQRLSDDIVSICKSAREDQDPMVVLIRVWNVMFDMIGCIPPDHEWQDVWVDALKVLQRRENLPPHEKRAKPDGVKWQELPWFLEQQRQSLDDADIDDDTRWKNLHSFAARLYASHVTRTHFYSIASFREAIENSDSSSSPPEPLIWVATEWMIRCSDRILQFLKESDAPKGEREEAMWRFGEAYAGVEGVGLLSVERWNLWKKWFTETKEKLSGETTSPEDTLILARISEALEKMNEAEERANSNPSPDDAWDEGI